MDRNNDRNRGPGEEPYRLRLPGFVAGEEVGLGDVVKRVTRTFGLKPCGGCEKRAVSLNRWVVVSGRARQ